MKFFDKWVVSGPFTAVDLGVFRIIFGIAALALLPNAQFLTAYPDSFFSPRPGVFDLFHSLPPFAVLVVLELLTALALAAVVFGVFTRVASVAAAVLLVTVFGFTYSFGKVDHTILLPLVPLVVVWAGWADRFSIDSLSQNRRERATPQAPLRLLAILIGVAFATAAVPKVLGGWWKVTTQATQGHYWYEYLIDGRGDGIASLFSGISSPLFWEPLDLVTLILEGGMIIAALNWRAFRIFISLAAVFHVGVLLMMNILFATNVVAYGAFVSWGLALHWLHRRGVRLPTLAARTWRMIAAVGVPVLAGLAWFISTTENVEAMNVIKIVLIVSGGIVGAAYLVFEIVRLFRWLRRRSSAERPGTSPNKRMSPAQ